MRYAVRRGDSFKSITIRTFDTRDAAEECKRRLKGQCSTHHWYEVEEVNPCSQCGDPVTNQDGSLSLKSFCSGQCATAWRESSIHA